MDIKPIGSRWMATVKGQINGVDYCFFAQSSDIKKAVNTVFLEVVKFKKQVKAFDEGYSTSDVRELECCWDGIGEWGA